MGTIKIQGGVKFGNREIAFTAENSTVEGALRAIGLDTSKPYAVMIGNERIASSEFATRQIPEGATVAVAQKVGAGYEIVTCFVLRQ